VTGERPGRFITLEGGDGAGKSTQAALLERWLQDGGRRVVRTREPGGTELGLRIREMVLHERGHIDPRAEALLYAADRAHHIETLVAPALAAGDVVVQDRYIDSSVAYQGVARGLGADRIRAVSDWAAGGLVPDRTILLDLDVAVGRARVAAARGDTFDRLESEAARFHESVRAAFLAMAEAEPDRFVVIDASLPPEEIAARIRVRLAPIVGLDA
jgi:dTMP kinase